MPQPLIGVDEVGRGCLSGPVYAAAVLFKSKIDIDKYFDSKQIKESKRKELVSSILENHSSAIGIGTVEEIEQFNIRQATFLAMSRAIQELTTKNKIVSGTLLIDGRDTLPNFEQFHQQAVIKGDQQVRIISAASLVAKVARDQFMMELHHEFSQYGYDKHKGYGTKHHRDQIQKYGPTIWHRKTFAGVKEYLSK